MEGQIEGTRRRGNQRKTWSSDVKDWCSLSYTKRIRMAESRKEWSFMAANLLRRRWQPTFFEEDGTHSDNEAQRERKRLLVI